MVCPNTPGSKIPSHGTNRLGSRYAYDFIQVDWNRKGYPAYQAGLLEYLLRGVSLARYYCWGQEVYAPCNGVVVEARDGYPERPRTNLLGDLANAYQNARHFDPDKDDVQAVAGNFVIIQCAEGVYAALVHLQTGSVQVAAGQSVTRGNESGGSDTPAILLPRTCIFSLWTGATWRLHAVCPVRLKDMKCFVTETGDRA